MFSFLEKNPFFFTLAFIFVFAIAGLVEILPNFFKSARPIEALTALYGFRDSGEANLYPRSVAIIAIPSLFALSKLRWIDMARIV